MGCLNVKNTKPVKVYSIFTRTKSKITNIKSLPYGPVMLKNKRSSNEVNDLINVKAKLLSAKLEGQFTLAFSMLGAANEEFSTEISPHFNGSSVKSHPGTQYPKISEIKNNLKFKPAYDFKSKIEIPIDLFSGPSILVSVCKNETNKKLSKVPIDQIEISHEMIVKACIHDRSFSIEFKSCIIHLQFSPSANTKSNYEFLLSVPQFDDSSFNYFYILYDAKSIPIYKSEMSSVGRDFNSLIIRQSELATSDERDQIFLEFYSTKSFEVVATLIFSIKEAKQPTNSHQSFRLHDVESGIGILSLKMQIREAKSFSKLQQLAKGELKFKLIVILALKSEAQSEKESGIYYKKPKSRFATFKFDHQSTPESNKFLLFEKKLDTLNEMAEANHNHKKTASALSGFKSSSKIETTQNNYSLNLVQKLNIAKTSFVNNLCLTGIPTTTPDGLASKEDEPLLLKDNKELFIKMNKAALSCSDEFGVIPFVMDLVGKIDSLSKDASKIKVINYLNSHQYELTASGLLSINLLKEQVYLNKTDSRKEDIGSLVRFISDKLDSELQHKNDYVLAVVVSNLDNLCFNEVKTKLIDASYLPASLIFNLHKQKNHDVSILSIKSQLAAISNQYQSCCRDFVSSLDFDDLLNLEARSRLLKRLDNQVNEYLMHVEAQ